MQSVELTLIKIIGDHFYENTGKLRKVEFNGKNFFDRYERIDSQLTMSIQKEHFEGKRVIAHDLINDKEKIVENIVFDYNGYDPDRFWHRSQLMLREMGFVNFTAYRTKTNGHLHLYVHKGHTVLSEAYQLANKLSMTLSQKMPCSWRMFPNVDMPREFQILNLPYDLFQKERGASWSKFM